MNLITPRSLRAITIGLIVIGLIVLALGGYLTPLFRVTLNPFITVQGWISTRFMALYDFLTVPKDVTSLRERNSQLESQNAQLQTQLIQLQQELSQSQAINALVGFARLHPESQYIAATVIGRDPSPFMKYVYIDAGSDDGLRHGMPVVTQDGLVGRIDAVTAGGARIQLITDPGSAVNIRLQTSNIDAVLTGSLTGDITLEMLPRDSDISVGEIVLTSGLGGSYPPNIFVGQVQSVQNKENELFKTATIQPLVNFSDLNAVLVVGNFQPVNLVPLQPTASP